MIGQTIELVKTNGILRPKNAELSIYQPSQPVKELTSHIKRDYQTGLEILEKPFREFDNRSVIEEMNENQRAFLIYSDIEFLSEDEKWRWDGVRPTVRNKILSIAAHLTAQVLVPGIFAQNQNDEEDKQMAEVMRLIMEWNIRNSDYDITFMNGVIAGLVNPVAYLSVDFIEAIQKVKKMMKNGKMKTEEAIDEVMSGLQVSNVPLDEIFITNPYEYNLQKQRAIGRRKYPEYSELQKIYGKHENWRFVKPGIRTIYSEVDSTFYDQKDEQLDTLAELFIYQNRGEDLEIPYVNGIYLGDDSDNPIEGNPMKHRDQEGRPKYNLVKFGAEPIDEKKFYFYKSIASKMMMDYKLTNETWRIVIDTEKLGMKPPVGVSGKTILKTDIYYPGAVANVDETTRFTPIPVGSARGGYNLIQAADSQISESTQDPFRQGLARDLPGTAFQQAQLTQNAKVQLGIIGKMLVQMVKDLGMLMIDDILNHQTVGEIRELMDGEQKLAFKKFLFPNQMEEGKTLTKEVRFEDMGELDAEIMRRREFELLEEEGGIDGKRRIMVVNPSLWRRTKFMIFVDADTLLPKNESFEQALKLDAYAKAIANPLIAGDVEALTAVTRDLLLGALQVTRGKEDKYLPKRTPQLLQGTQTPERRPLSAQVAESDKAGALSELMKA